MLIVNIISETIKNKSVKMSANGGDNSAGRLQQAQKQVGEVVDIMRVNVEKVKLKVSFSYSFESGG